ncbi:MAG: LPXTG cell wall anchor domain-containing protein [Acidimicrobiales bacterium]
MGACTDVLPATGGGNAGLVAAGLVAVALALALGWLGRRRCGPVLVVALSVCSLTAITAVPARAEPCSSDASSATGTPAAPIPATYLVGAAVESIDPTPAMIDGGSFFLGGYGIGSGEVAGVPVLPGRRATGVLDGVNVRALAVGAGEQSLVLAQIDTQGVFAAYKRGPYGEEDMRRDAAAEIARRVAASPGRPALPAGAILVDSNHTHGGPDTVGVWGGVPDEYLQLVHDRTVLAIVEAWDAMRPATLWYGTAKGGVEQAGDAQPLISNQFGNDPANEVADDELRLLQARDATTGETLVTYLNFSAHATVLGSDNTLISADYTGPLSRKLGTLGGIGFQQVGTLGRTQPARSGCPDESLSGAAGDLCALDAYAGRVFDRALVALADAKPLVGAAVVSMHSYLVVDPATNALIFGADTGGFLAGVPILRQNLPPWATGNIISTVSYSGRIGDLLISGSPGEPYPQIPLAVRDAVPGQLGYLSIGTAGDFLGYLIAPLSAYPEPIRRTILDGGPVPNDSVCSGIPSPIGCPSPIDNDTFAFNPSLTLGERIICSLLRGAGETLGVGPDVYPATRPMCVAFAADRLLPADADTTLPTGPYVTL